MIDFEDASKEEVFECALGGEMAKILISAMDWDKEYSDYKDNQCEIIIGEEKFKKSKKLALSTVLRG